MAAPEDSGNASTRYDYMDRKRFLKEYKLKIASEFEVGGHAANWARDGHRFWGKEDATMDLEKNDTTVVERYDDDSDEEGPDVHDVELLDASAALSPDERFLAISTNAVIRLYDVSSRAMVLKLQGHEENIDQLHFAPIPSVDPTGNDGEAYTLVSWGDLPGHYDGRIITWRLSASASGMQLLCDPSSVQKSTKSRSSNEVPPSLKANIPRAGFRNPISPDGRRLLTLEQTKSTQGGLRPLPEMPRVVIRDLADYSELWRLTGHQDAIIWAGWSPNGKQVAEASWDEPYGIWNPNVKDRADGHLIGPSGGQNWVGDFSADSKYVVFSGGRPTKVACYDVASGAEIAVLDAPLRREYGWIRELVWAPDRYTLAVVVNQQVLLWRPLDDNTMQVVFKIESDGGLLEGFNRLRLLKWADGGRKLIVRDLANTVYVWDMESNKKWRLQRQDGLELRAPDANAVFFTRRLFDEGTILSVDGDGRVRFWNL